MLNNQQSLQALFPNLDKPVVRLRHASLKRSGRGLYRSVCPACRWGALPMHRGAKFELLREDMCVGCGQRVEYLDHTVNGEALHD